MNYNKQDPNYQGTIGYPVWLHKQQLQRHQNGELTIVSLISLSRQRKKLELYQMTGNAERRKLIRIDLILLGIIVTIYPKVSLDEMTMFIYNE